MIFIIKKRIFEILLLNVNNEVSKYKCFLQFFWIPFFHIGNECNGHTMVMIKNGKCTIVVTSVVLLNLLEENSEIATGGVL